MARKNVNGNEPKIGEFYSSVKLQKCKWDYLPVNIYKGFKYQNELHNDGIVHETNGNKGLYKYEDEYDEEELKKLRQKHKGKFVMIRFSPRMDYLCIGRIEYIMRYDPKRNKIFLQK